MNIKDYVKENDDIVVLATADQVKVGRVIFDAAQKRIDFLLKAAKKTNDPNEAFCKLQELKALEWIINLPNEAKSFITPKDGE